MIYYLNYMYFLNLKQNQLLDIKLANEAKAETTKPLYKAPITFLLFPSLTKKVPIIDVKIQAPPIVKG